MILHIKLFATYFTLEPLVGAVLQHVTVQVAFLAVPFVTLGTLILLLQIVYKHMTIKVIFHRKLLFAHLALVLLLRDVG